MIKRAHAEERPYRLIVPVVLLFRPLVAHFLLLVLALASGEAERGEAGGDCLENRGQLINPPQLPLLETLREQAPLTGRAAKREKCTK